MNLRREPRRSTTVQFAYLLVTLCLAFANGCVATPQSGDGSRGIAKGVGRRVKSAPSQPSTRSVDALATLSLEEGVVGRSFPVSVTVAGTQRDDLQLIFNERHSPGSGAMWRASELSAAVQAMLATSVPPDGLKIQYDVQGDIDGPSAGALITVALMAAIQGDALLVDVSMTGTINPDGSIGAVSMIPEKVRAAGRDGIHTVLIPIGLRRGVDGRGPDVVEIGHSIGVDVREVGDVYEAYEAMTGVSFSHVASVVPIPAFDTAFAAALDERAAIWRERYERHRAALAPIDRRQVARFGSHELLARATRYIQTSDRLRAEGRHAAAYDTSLSAGVIAAVARFLPEALARYDAGDLSSVRAWLDRQSHVERTLETTLAEMQQIEPASFNDFVALGVAYGSLIEAISLERSGNEILAAAAADSAASRLVIEGAIVEAIMREIEAAMLVTGATDYLAFRAALAGEGRVVGADLEVVADVLSKAADANLMLFDSVILAAVAREHNLPLGVIRERFAVRSKIYREVVAVETYRSRIDPYIHDEMHRLLARTGLDLWRYVGSAELLATHYSLAVSIDPRTLRIDRFAVTPPLKAMFESSEKQISRSLSALQDLGIDPQLVLATHQIGAEEGRSALALGDGPLLMRSLRHMWATRVLTEAFLLGLDPAD